MESEERIRRFRERRQKLEDEGKTDPLQEEVTKALGAYRDTFESSFPIIGYVGTREDLLRCVDDCISQGKDVYELGYMTDPEEEPGVLI